MWVGIDLITIDRASAFIDKAPQTLGRFFHPHEIDYAATLLGHAKVSYLAACFAAKEAFYKAFCHFLVHEKNAESVPSLWRVGRYIKMSKHPLGLPLLEVDVTSFGYCDVFEVCLSYSHENNQLVAVVIVKDKK